MKIIFFWVLTLIGASTSTTIECEFKLKSFYLYPDRYTCEVKSVSDNCLTKVEAIKGTHFTGYDHTSVKTIFSYGTPNPEVKKSQRIPRNFGSFFPNIEVIYWGYGNIATITADDLKQFPSLKCLFLSSNSIKAIDGNLFQHTQGLQHISFYFNRIQNVGFGLLDGLNTLKIVDFQSNPCISYYAYTPEKIEQLKMLLEVKCPSVDDQTTSISNPEVESESCTPESELTTEKCSCECNCYNSLQEKYSESIRKKYDSKGIQITFYCF